MSMSETKSELRKKHLNLRNAMSKSEVLERSSFVCKNLLALKCVQNAKTILMYHPLGNEVDLTSMYELFAVVGKKIFLPYTEDGDMLVGEWRGDKDLEMGEYGIMVPSVDKDEQTQGALCTAIDVVLVPGIVFDKKGNRVGFGKGYYDRFLAKTKPDCVKVAVCYDNQMALDGDGIPAEPQDVKMDYIVTESGVIVSPD